MGLAIVLTAIAIAASVTAWSLSGKAVNAPWVIFVFAFAVSLAVTGWNRFRQSDADAKRRSCEERVERSDGNRSQWTDIGAYLDSEGLTDAGEYVRERLEINLPQLSKEDC